MRSSVQSFFINKPERWFSAVHRDGRDHFLFLQTTAHESVQSIFVAAEASCDAAINMLLQDFTLWVSIV
jgi:hypothetical protein